MSAQIQPAFTPIEQKLVRLALCPAAQTGEIDSAGRALIASWRKRGLLTETLLQPNAAIIPSSRSAFSPGDVIMPFGKYRGLALRKLRASYLRWLLKNCDDLQPELSRAIHAVLHGD